MRSLLLASLFAFATPAEAPVPDGWHMAGDNPKAYAVVVDKANVKVNKQSALLKSIEPSPKGFGTLMQTVAADDYRGKRVRFSAYVKTAGVDDWAGLWMRVDTQSGMGAFDNMEPRAIKGTTDWKKYDVVLDIAPDAKDVAFGVLLSAAGQVWIDGITIEVVDKSVKTTDVQESYPKKPVNVDFAK
jgi:hypothetical protein